MAKRLNDTAAVIGMSPYESQSEHYSHSVRKIDNGFICNEYHSGPNCPDGPTSKEYFMPEHPGAATEGVLANHGNAMKRAVEFMRK